MPYIYKRQKFKEKNHVGIINNLIKLQQEILIIIAIIINIFGIMIIAFFVNLLNKKMKKIFKKKGFILSLK